MTINGVEVTCFSEFDGKPIKNKLPEKIKNKMKTEKQWREEGFRVIQDEKGYEMHPTEYQKKLYTYFFYMQVEDLGEVDLVCETCHLRQGKFCPVIKDYIDFDEICSEWS